MTARLREVPRAVAVPSGAPGTSYDTAVQRPFLSTMAMLVAVSALSACGWKDEPLDARAERYPLTTPDSSGRPVTIDARPEAVVTTDAAAATILEALRPDGELRALPNADADALDGVEADLLVVADRSGEPPSLGPSTPVFRYGAPRFEDVPDAVSRLALAVGRGPEGVRLATDLARRLDAVRARGAAARKVRVFIDAGALQTVDVDRPLARAVLLAGGTLIRTSPGPVSLVRLRRFDPQVWLVLPASGTQLRLLRRRAETKAITAVRTGKVVPVNEAAYAPGIELPSRLGELVDLLHEPAS